MSIELFESIVITRIFVVTFAAQLMISIGIGENGIAETAS